MMMRYFTVIRILALVLLAVVEAAKFEIKGPVVTITLKDPVEARRSSAAAVATSGKGAGGDVMAEAPLSLSFSTAASSSSASQQQQAAVMSRPWISSLGSIRPKVYWSIQSQSQPLPNWLPSLKSIRANVAYEYHELKRLPSRLEGVAKFSTPQGDVVLKPSIQFSTTAGGQQHIGGGASSSSPATTTAAGRYRRTLAKRYNLLVEASRGLSSVGVALGPGGSGAGARSLLRCLRGSFGFHLPYQTVSHVQVSPVWDLNDSSSSSTTTTNEGFSCRVEAVSGGAARTKALLHLEYQNPTLTVVHALDNRNTVAPCICLYSGRIVYQWDLRLGDENNSNSFLRTRVDPVSAIDFTWTDQSSTDGGLWETNVRLPLEGTTLEALAADVRIRRQFQF